MHLNLGIDLSIANYLKNVVNQTVADYQAKIGEFMGFKARLLKSQSLIQKMGADPQASQLAVRITTAIARQVALEGLGTKILSSMNTLQNDATAKEILSGKIPGILEAQKWVRVNELYNTAKALETDVKNFLSNIGSHKQEVETIEKNVFMLAGNSGINTGSLMKLLPLALGGMFILTRGFGLLKKSRKR